ncbi:hypothetical protein FOZ60_007285 [Perkinsus olseni]|uniref:CCHC-type domain-containing protein n=1 Tax=Perkinsus olseni TaxID=32597 RepID=A0A7J6NM05_PEROL|nr:hypothetical protein FOZ60_007285 [Perkinsus olseni]
MGSEQGINVYSETESALYREAYEKLYGEAPPVDPTGSIGQRDAQQTELFPSVSNDSTPAETTSQEEVPSKESEENEEEGITQGGESVQDKGKGLQRNTVPKPESQSVDPSLGKIPSGTSSLSFVNAPSQSGDDAGSMMVSRLLSQLSGMESRLSSQLQSQKSSQEEINATIFSRLDSLSSGIDNMRNGVPVGTPRKGSVNDTVSFAGGMAADRNYIAIWKSDKTTGYSNADVNWVETDNNQKTVTPTAPDGDKSDKGNQMKSGGYQQSNTVSAESKNNCMRCGKSGHTSPFCTADYVMRSRRCFNCGKEGHRAAFCVVPRSSLRCKRCGQTGHVSWLCRRPWSQVISMKNSTGKDGEKPAGSEPPKPKQPVGEYTTKMVYETSSPTTETVASVAGGGNEGSQIESPTESPTEQKLSTISCEAQTIANMELEDGFLTASFEVYSPHELVKVKGLLDTGASVGFIREDFAESLVSHGAVGDMVVLSKPRKHKLDVGWKGPYPVKAIQGVKVTVDMNGRDVVDSTSNVLKLVLWFSLGTQRQAGCLKVQAKIC